MTPIRPVTVPPPPGAPRSSSRPDDVGRRRPPEPDIDRAQWRTLVGRRGETIAVRYLIEHGWQVLDRNWRPGAGLRGELDIVALDPGAPGESEPPGRPRLVAVEVKTRTGQRAGPPSAAIDARKLARLRALAATWAARHDVRHAGLRLDVVSILVRPGRPALLRHHRGVGS